jgi:hypothetical protein
LLTENAPRALSYNNNRDWREQTHGPAHDGCGIVGSFVGALFHPAGIIMSIVGALVVLFVMGKVM